MRDTRKYAASKMGYSKGILARTEMPPDVIEDTCPLCGHFMPLEDNGYCATDECKENARDAIRRMVRENGGKDIPGVYYRFGDQEFFLLKAMEKWKEPQPIKHADMCQEGVCVDWARTGDHLCGHHRIIANRDAYRARTQGQRKAGGKLRPPKLHGNKIRGLDKIKL